MSAIQEDVIIAKELKLGGKGDSVKFQLDASNISNDKTTFQVQHGSTTKFAIVKNTDVTHEVVLRIGTSYMWLDTNNDLRVHTSYPTSDTDGTIVGTQT